MIQRGYGTEREYFDAKGRSIYFSMHPEMAPMANGISPTGRYFIYCIHPERGSAHFILEQDEQCKWLSDNHPPFISEDIISWIGDRIELKNK